MKCIRCNNTILQGEFHDCKGEYDLERYLAGGELPRSAKKRLKKKYGVTSIAEISKAIGYKEATKKMYKGLFLLKHLELKCTGKCNCFEFIAILEKH